MTNRNRPLRVGLFGIGLDAYWPQFKGLKSRLEGYLGEAGQRLQRPGVEVVNLGLIDSPPKALEAGHQFRAADVDLIFLHVTTYALVLDGAAGGAAGQGAGDHPESPAGGGH